ncbi:Sperm-associated antigen 17 [Rhizophlyctis rosea]|nr:Sperm-associated antigen 17 [Rhizophlyctis rosea]
MPDGTIMKYLSDSTTEIFHSNGNTTSHDPRTNSWTSTDQSGKRITTIPNSEAFSTQLQLVVEKDPATGRVVTTREDMVTVTKTEDGKIVTEHCDQTVIISKPGEVEVDCEGLGTVTFMNDGGVRVRLPDGTIAFRQQGGKEGEEAVFIVQKPDIILEVSTSGHARMYPDRTFPDTDSNVYHINWLEGTLNLSDSNQIHFTIDANGLAQVSPTTYRIATPPSPHNLPAPTIQNLLNAAQDRLPQIPNAPRLFVINPDGSGVALWRDVDLITYFKEQLASPDVEITEEIILREEGGSARDIDGVSVMVVGPPKGNRGHGVREGEFLVYRQLTRFPTLTPNVRACVMFDDPARYWRDVDNSSLPSNVADPRPENTFQHVEGLVLEKRPFIFGQDRQATEEAIIKKFKLKEEQTRQVEGEIHEVGMGMKSCNFKIRSYDELKWNREKKFPTTSNYRRPEGKSFLEGASKREAKDRSERREKEKGTTGENEKKHTEEPRTLPVKVTAVIGRSERTDDVGERQESRQHEAAASAAEIIPDTKRSKTQPSPSRSATETAYTTPGDATASTQRSNNANTPASAAAPQTFSSCFYPCDQASKIRAK